MFFGPSFFSKTLACIDFSPRLISLYRTLPLKKWYLVLHSTFKYPYLCVVNGKSLVGWSVGSWKIITLSAFSLFQFPLTIRHQLKNTKS